MNRTRIVVLALAAAVALIALAHLTDASAEDRMVTIKVRVALPPGVKGSDVTADAYSGLIRRPLDDNGRLEIQIPASYEFAVIKVNSPNGLFAARPVWVASGQSRDVVFTADDLTTDDAFNAPDKVFERGKAAAARGDTTGVKAAADELEQGAKVVSRYGTEYEQQEVYNGYRKELEGLPPSFIDDFFRDLGQAQDARGKAASHRQISQRRDAQDTGHAHLPRVPPGARQIHQIHQ